jgi:hypothetical protein
MRSGPLIFLAVVEAFTSQAAGAVPHMSKLDRVSLRLDTFDVEITLNDEVLGHGVVQVNRFTPATYSLESTSAAGATCLPLGPSRSSSYRAEVHIYKYGGNATDPDTYNFKATIDKTDLAGDCVNPVKSQSRTEKLARMRRGQDMELIGPNGLRLELHRR